MVVRKCANRPKNVTIIIINSSAHQWAAVILSAVMRERNVSVIGVANHDHRNQLKRINSNKSLERGTTATGKTTRGSSA